MEKMEIKEVVSQFSPCDMDVEIVNEHDAWNLLSIPEKAKEKYKKFCIDYDCEYSQYSAGSFTVYGVRDETDEEFEVRKVREAEARKKDRETRAEYKRKKDEADRVLYEKLKKKFDK